MKQKVLGISENKWLLSANYYDEKYREVQSVSQLYPTGREMIYKKYDYIGRLTRILEKQTIGAKQEGFDRYLSYDNSGRLVEVKQKMLGYISTDLVSIAKYTYNDLSQIAAKTNHNGIDTTQYSYSIDGKQIGASSPLFSYKLYFDQKPVNMNYAFTPRYDGNVSFMEWNSWNTKAAYRYDYDALKQLKDASYGSPDKNSLWVMGKEYGEHDITYDSNGNIKTLKRTNASGTNQHDITNNYNGNQLMQANINGVGYNYSYDGNGNMIYDGYKGVNIIYNMLNLPEKIVAGSDEVSYVYSAGGVKLAAKFGSSTTYYRGSFVYNNDELDHIIHPEGIIRKTSGAYVYYYAKKDHLGSTRILCHAANGKMMVDQGTDYYAFGLAHQLRATNTNRYLFSGKELQDQYLNGSKLMLYDFGARNYDPVLGRWFNIDPLAAKYYSTSPYVYCLNNPIVFIDPNGEEVNIYGIDRYLNRENRLAGGTINNDMMRTVGGFEVSPYQNKAGEIIGWSAFRDGRIQYVMDADDIEEFTKNVSTYSVAADMFYMNGMPDEGMLKMLAGKWAEGLGQQWKEAIKDPGFLMYVANAIGGAAMMLPKGGTKAYSHGYSYSERVLSRAVDASHKFPYSFDDAILSTKPLGRPNNYNIYRMGGRMNGRTGVYEIGVSNKKIIDHRFFRPNK